MIINTIYTIVIIISLQHANFDITYFIFWCLLTTLLKFQEDSCRIYDIPEHQLCQFRFHFHLIFGTISSFILKSRNMSSVIPNEPIVALFFLPSIHLSQRFFNQFTPLYDLQYLTYRLYFHNCKIRNFTSFVYFILHNGVPPSCLNNLSSLKGLFRKG